MTIEALRELRRNRKRPALVTVVVGKLPKWAPNDSGWVSIDRHPAELDLRALVGIPVSVIVLDESLEEPALSAIDSIGAKVKGVCGSAGSCGVSAKHELLMRKMREALCPT